MRVAICIATCKRPRWLAALLASLTELSIDEASIELSIIVVDNDSEGTAQEAVNAARAALRWPLSYVIEPKKGISFARNRAVRLALAWKADSVAFVDDDETVDRHWLEELLTVHELYGADVVTGPVVPLYQPDVAGWVVEGRFFERPRYSTGTLLKCAITANCLISARLLVDSAEPFHPAFAIGGGGDTHFFRQAHANGACIVWADGAIAFERVPASRANAGWLLARAYRGGTSFALSERLLHRTPMWAVLRTCTGALRALEGVGLLLPSIFLGKAGIVRALRTACAGVGLLTGVLGMSYREYTVIHGE